MIDNSSRPERGFLMDLDLAIREERVAASGASHRTGMPHTYRHDRESFFSFFYGSQHFTRPSPRACLRNPRPTNNIFDQSSKVENIKCIAFIKKGFVETAPRIREMVASHFGETYYSRRCLCGTTRRQMTRAVPKIKCLMQ
jgi:hypothetical protein